MKKLLTALLIVFPFCLLAQTRIDSTMAIKGNTTAKYSLFIPSNYDPFGPRATILAMHPFNPEKWDAAAWCDELMIFAEENKVVLVCPDGGEDGRIDDPADTAFASILLDSVQQWYLIDPDRIFLMGFSWGGKATYTYGLAHSSRISGCIPIGAALSGTEDLKGLFQYAKNKPFFIIHGERDSPEIRFQPVRDSLVVAGAFVKSRLIRNSGHTIRFEHKDKLFGRAFRWVDSVASFAADSANLARMYEQEGMQNKVPEELRSGRTIHCKYQVAEPGTLRLKVSDLSGKTFVNSEELYSKGNHVIKIKTKDLPWGVYQLEIKTDRKIDRFKFKVRG